ncbi:MAG TPA: NUDIX hydrolase [Burkholderiaceae bacterium]|nr:NUDIX hydrolase [Burkholderiaceae bacterium]
MTVPDDDLHDPALAERPLDGEMVYQGHFLQVRRDVVALPDGQQASREYIVHPGAVVIVPVLENGRLVLERQYRHPVGRVMIEFPAGKLDPGEPTQRCAERELREETGYRAREWARAGVLHNAIAYSTEGIEIWFARGLEPGAQQLDEGEFVDVFTASEEELAAWIRDGRVTDAKTMIGLLWLQQWRRGEWALEWVPATDRDDPR